MIAIYEVIKFKYGNSGVYKQDISVTVEDLNNLKYQLDNLDFRSPLNILTLNEPDLTFFI